MNKIFFEKFGNVVAGCHFEFVRNEGQNSKISSSSFERHRYKKIFMWQLGTNEIAMRTSDVMTHPIPLTLILT